MPNPRGVQFEHLVGSVRLTTARGRRFYMDASIDQGHGMHVTYSGPYGRLDVDELAGHARLVIRRSEHRDAATTRYGMPWEENVFTIAPADAVTPTRAVVKALVSGEDYPDGEVGRMAVETLVGAYASHEQNGRMIHLGAGELARERVFPWA